MSSSRSPEIPVDNTGQYQHAVDVLQLRLDLLNNGYLPVPITSPQAYIRGMPFPKAGKAPLLRDWRMRSAKGDADGVVGWTVDRPEDTNTGLLCGSLIGVDLDIMDAELVALVEEAAMLLLGPTPLHRFGRASKVMLAFKASGDAWAKHQTAACE